MKQVIYWIIVTFVLALPAAGRAAGGERTSRISDEAVPLINPDDFPKRPRLLLELGPPLLGTGPLGEGFELPGGAVWQPALSVFGTFRTAVQGFDNGVRTNGEWANRLDLYANLQLSGTERILLGLRPLDQIDNRTGRLNFTEYNFSGDPIGWQDHFNGNLRTLFFEGDFGEIFPNLDPEDSGILDFGFSVGRQPLFYQEGMLLNDTVDAVGIIRNTLLPPGGSDLQIAMVYAWDNIHQGNNVINSAAQFVGLFTQGDFRPSTVNFDFVGVFNASNSADGVFWGLSSVQRIGHVNTSFRFLGSQALGQNSPAVDSGYLLFTELSLTPPWTHNLLYMNAFWGIDNFTSVAREPGTGGPLGRVGILFAAVGLGRYGAALSNQAQDAAGAAIGYQIFSADTRTQLILEFGGRNSTSGPDQGALAFGARFQHALGQHVVLQLDAFGAAQKKADAGWGTRFETRVEF